MRKIAFALVAATALTGAALTGPALAQTTTPAPAAQFISMPADAVLSRNIVGLNLQDGAKENVGEIKDIVLTNGQLSGYIVSVGGFLGMGERYVIVSPVSVAVTYDQNAKKWMGTINATKDQLKAAPEYKYEGRVNQG